MAVADGVPVARIINGQPVGANEADFYVALMSRYSWNSDNPGSTYNQFCGATHIGDGKVLTAAHCLDAMLPYMTHYLLFGDTSADMANEYCTIDKETSAYHCVTDRDGTPDTDVYEPTGFLAYAGGTSNLIPFNTRNIRIHEAWDGDFHDIAVIELDTIVNHPAASLPEANYFDYSASINEIGGMVAIGYGDTLADADESTYIPSDDLLKVELNALTDNYCRSYWGGDYSSGYMLCAESSVNGSPCQGDSGGPLVRPEDQIVYGIVSFGTNPCNSAPSVFTEVLAYRDWIINEQDSGSTDPAPTKRSAGAFSGITLLSMMLLLLARSRKQSLTT